MEYEFEIPSGRVVVHHERCRDCEVKACIPNCPVGILKLKGSGPVLAVSEKEAAKRGCIECLACEQECLFQGRGAITIELPIPGLAEWRAANR